MAMTPEERNRMDRLEKTVEALSKVQDTAFVENMKRRLGITEMLKSLRLTDLFDVDALDATNGQVIKLNTSSHKWEAANDNDT